jgi:murein DD-endopeptidase MepM/ murein hydrolase activator NlpD
LSGFRERDRFEQRQSVELGNEPALRMDGEVNEFQVNTPINLRWLSGTLLTGFTGIALIAGSVFTAMQSEARLAISPEALQIRNPAYSSQSAGGSNSLRKADRITLASTTADIRQTLRLSSVHSTGGKEVVRTRPVVRLSVALTQVKDTALDFPSFNPSSIYALSNQNTAPASEDPLEAESTGDVSYVTRTLSDIRDSALNGPEIPLAQVLQKVKETAALEAMINTQARSDMEGVRPDTLAFGGDSEGNQGFGFPPRLPGQRSLPQNMSSVAKTTDTSRPNVGTDTNITITEGDRLEAILAKKGVTSEDIRSIKAALGADSGYGNVGVQPGQTLSLLMPDEAEPRRRPLRVMLRSGPEIASRIALNDAQRYVRIEPEDDDSPVPGASLAQNLSPRALQPGGREVATLYESIYTTALWQNVPKDVIEEMIRIFGHEEDLQRKVLSSDSLDILYAEQDEARSDAPREILYAALHSGGETHRYYFFQPPGETSGDYFDSSGRSARKFLINKPLAAGVLRSGFGSRRHPILGYTKMHTGVDWAAPRGTPIFSAADGVIKSAGWSGGYGRAVRIDHANAHETLYAHMSSFARDVKAGSRVKQGQVIGYVGSTGLSTGPHLHYEIRINDRLQDPMRLRIPKQEELRGEALAQFERERERLDNVMGRNISADRRTQGDDTRG